jgi:hypothetical protein
VTDNPTVSAVCPSCGQAVRVPTIRDSIGLLHPPMPLPISVLVAHQNCVLDRLIKELSAAAMRNSKVTVFRIQE